MHDEITTHQPQRSLRVFRVAVPGLAVAALAFGALLASHGDASVPTAAAGPLAKLSSDAASEPSTAKGDATLLRSTGSGENAALNTEVELFTDSGDDYYGTTDAALAAAIRSGAKENTDAPDGMSREIAIAKSVKDKPIEEARREMVAGALDPGIKVPTFTRDQQDNRIWVNGMEALLGAAGDPEVRAGVFTLLSTIPSITTTKDTLDGEPVIVFSAPYQERLTVRASDGVPVAFASGAKGTPSEVKIAYEVSRVTTSDLAKR